jgi:hypothetical protein
MLREINFKVFIKLLRKHKLKSITIDIDSSVVNVEGHQEGAVKGYNPKKLGNNCYNLQFAFCDEIKAYLTGYVRSGDTYTSNGTSEMIKEIMAYLKDEGLEITFRMDSGYFDDEILETIESFGCTYVIKGKEYSTLVAQVTNPSIVFVNGEEGRETAELTAALNTWDKARRFVVSRVLKDEKDRKQLSFLEGEEYDYFFFVTNTELSSVEVVEFYEKRGNCENYIKEAKYDMAVGHLLLQSFWSSQYPLGIIRSAGMCTSLFFLISGWIGRGDGQNLAPSTGFRLTLLGSLSSLPSLMMPPNNLRNIPMIFIFTFISFTNLI